MGGAADEIDLALAQPCIGLVDGKNKLVGNIEPFACKKAEFNGSDGRKIRVGDEIGDCELHRPFLRPLSDIRPLAARGPERDHTISAEGGAAWLSAKPIRARWPGAEPRPPPPQPA